MSCPCGNDITNGTKMGAGQVSETLVTAKCADQAHQDGWMSGATCQEIGVSTCRGGSVPGDIPASIGAYRPAPSSTRVANILEVIRGEKKQLRTACVPGEFKWGANVVKATSAAHRRLVQDAAGWFCELD